MATDILHNHDSKIPALIVSIVVHIALMISLYFLNVDDHLQRLPVKRAVAVKIVDRKAEEKPKAVELTPPPPPPPVTRQPEIKKTKPPLSERAVASKQPVTTPQKPVLGLDASSVAQGESKSTIVVPIGNSLLTKERGKPGESVAPIVGDQSADAILIPASIKTPEYTAAAIDVGLQGDYIVDVFVDAQGNVSDLMLRKKVGFGMDARLLAAARQAKFSPRKNAQGLALATWTEIKFKLEIP